jgi:microcompartment protein CcmL/EutN
MIQMIEGTNASVQSLTEVVSRTIEQVQALAVTTQVLATNDTNIKAAVDQHSEALRAQEELRFKLVRENEAAHSALLDKISQLQVLMLQSTSGVKDKVDERSTEAAVRFQNWVAQGGIVALGVLLGYLIGHWRP